MRTCKDMGIKTVAIYSDADAQAVSFKFLVHILGQSACFVLLDHLLGGCSWGMFYMHASVSWLGWHHGNPTCGYPEVKSGHLYNQDTLLCPNDFLSVEVPIETWSSATELCASLPECWWELNAFCWCYHVASCSYGRWSSQSGTSCGCWQLSQHGGYPFSYTVYQSTGSESFSSGSVYIL